MSDIIIVETPKPAEPKKYDSPRNNYLRESIKQHIGLLRRELGHYEQTTHGRLSFNESIETVLHELVKCYYEPSAYNISSLSQAIDGWEKGK